MSGVEVPSGSHEGIGDLRVVARGTIPPSQVRAPDPFADLIAAAAKARAEFGLSCFWNAPVLPDPIEDARLVVGRLRKYGGRRGWAVATSLDKAVREAAGASEGVDTVPAQGADPSGRQPVALELFPIALDRVRDTRLDSV